MKDMIRTREVRDMLEKAKDDVMEYIPEGGSILSYSAERFVNHGVMIMFYEVYQKILEYELEMEG